VNFCQVHSIPHVLVRSCMSPYVGSPISCLQASAKVSSTSVCFHGVGHRVTGRVSTKFTLGIQKGLMVENREIGMIKIGFK
jgi:hypothetical protein